MGSATSDGLDQALLAVTGTFAAIGASGRALAPVKNEAATISYSPAFTGLFNVALWGTFAATMVLERSFDGGTTFMAVSSDTVGTANTYTAPMSMTVTEVEQGVLYRWRCSAYTSGTVNYRISR